jgi:hypothetical protein
MVAVCHTKAARIPIRYLDCLTARLSVHNAGESRGPGFEALGTAILVAGVIWSFVLAAVAVRRSG